MLLTKVIKGHKEALSMLTKVFTQHWVHNHIIFLAIVWSFLLLSFKVRIQFARENLPWNCKETAFLPWKLISNDVSELFRKMFRFL